MTHEVAGSQSCGLTESRLDRVRLDEVRAALADLVLRGERSCGEKKTGADLRA